MVSKWATIEFTVLPYKDTKDTFILGPIDEIQVWITDACRYPSKERIICMSVLNRGSISHGEVLLVPLKCLQLALEDSLVTMSTILASRFVAGIRNDVEKVERQLSLFAETLDQWVQVWKHTKCQHGCSVTA